MTGLASLPAALRRRVTVHPHTLQESGLHGMANVAICHNMVACLPPASRRSLWPALADALVAGVSCSSSSRPPVSPCARPHMISRYSEWASTSTGDAW
ncbi:hypothetical protein [Streptomyces sp. NBC_01800]|uniref:hypothetical protein n=1 Tax=Streptomyces sp. NBC_01800 TaxID=2975945 RepID=UPI002DDB361B|nr:hypothetical protein [Streptomyces sp. NBC_01800]WSA72626.1 hypothetical protein OIE65_40180 [Streptomyces sp. NBC_01800]